MPPKIRSLLPACALAALASMPAAAQEGDPILEANGIQYACAGVGKASRGDPRWADFAVRLEFAAANGDFLGDPAVTVSDGAGKPVFTAQCNGPWVLIQLSPGTYQVHATGQKGQYAKDFALSVKADGQTRKTIRLP